MSILSEKVLAIIKEIEPIYGRKALQKKIYFAQVLGLDLGYDYKWYKYGPYSFDLADEIDFYISTGEIMIDRENYHQILVNATELPSLDRNEFKKIKKLNDLTKDMIPDDLELMASIHFLVYEAGLGKKKGEVFQKLEIEKPGKFTDVKKEAMWKRLESFGLI